MGHCLSSSKTNTYFTTDEVSQHNIDNDCWLIANNKVYDVTHFLNKHVGMKGIILNKGGQDCSSDYKMHTTRQKLIWKQYLIGYLK